MAKFGAPILVNASVQSPRPAPVHKYGILKPAHASAHQTCKTQAATLNQASFGTNQPAHRNAPRFKHAQVHRHGMQQHAHVNVQINLQIHQLDGMTRPARLDAICQHHAVDVHLDMFMIQLHANVNVHRN